jgi:hypothetical protein
MLPFRRNKIDISNLNPEEKKNFAKYGAPPSHKSGLMFMQKDRKFFDSGDYALSKAGKTPREAVGTAIPNPENIPHASPTPVSNHSGPHISVQISPVNSPTSPAKESSLSQESTLADIMGPDPAPSDTTVETESIVVEEVVELIDSTENAQEVESKTTEPGSGDSDIKMD